MALTNKIALSDIDFNESGSGYEAWKASGTLYKNREMWLDKFFDLDKTMGDMVIKLRGMNIHRDTLDYEQTSREVFSRFLKLMGAQGAIPMKKDGTPNNQAFPIVKFKNLPQVTAKLNGASNHPLGNNVQLATFDNEFLTVNNMIIGMYDQITPTNVSSIMNDFPEAMYPAIGLYIASWELITGMTHQHQTGNGFADVRKRNVDYQFYKTQPFAEKVVWHQEEVIGLRQPDSNNFMDRGLPLYMAKNMSMLEHRRQTRMVFDIYRGIYDGVIYNNGAPLSYNISPLNRLTGSQIGGAPWATFDPTLGTILSINGSVNVTQALRNLVHAILKKYTGYKLQLKMCSLTLSAIIGNPTITPITNFGPAIQQPRGDEGQLEQILRGFMGTNQNIEVVIDDAMYVPDIDDPLGRYNPALPADKQIPYFLNDVGKIFIAPQVQATGAGMGQYAYTPTVQNGGMYNPQPGAAYFMIDTFASNTTDGMENPSLSQAVIWSALPLVFRPNDLYTLDITQ